ncbi:carbohydrate ABC transporter permease [Halalkalibacter sp. APA_J-10(15)]|uniref:carbohydrate ABC transporter permease n=1 Tax=Halalkalibacter sp. APA_J-10(15) TaxID=2933805 RepID=UPI001FF1D518|nr:carbohydrate ABC transporter permease [Halalkalibacter sp. APA_J-10(15)]MCK0472801.1 carbohydrate ABC transporter permease [Halalkalibacter sp. APA_J-10(15)]
MKKLSFYFFHFLLMLFALIMIYPLLWMFASSFKENSEIFVNAHTLIPVNWDLSNYLTGWQGFGGVTFGTFFKNSFIIVTITTIGAVFFSSLIAYAFARIPFKGKSFWFVCMMMTMMLPYEVLMVPQYIMFNWFGWINSFKPLILPTFFGFPFFIFLMIQFIRTIPYELDEAAKIDGCNRYSIFFRIILPLIKPALVTAAIFSFYWRWDDFIGPLLYLNRPDLYPVSLALKLYSDPDAITNWGAMFAMSALSLIPVFLMFLFFQKYIVEGISTSGLKS